MVRLSMPGSWACKGSIGLLLVLAVPLVGCSPSTHGRVEVAGQVSIDGAPIEQGGISFIPLPPLAGPTAGARITAGKYQIPAIQGPLPGKHRVEIKAMRKTGRQIVNDMQPPPDNLVDEIEQFVPPRYNTQSTLTMDIIQGKNEQANFELKSKP